MGFTWGSGSQAGAGQFGGTWGRRPQQPNQNMQTGQMADGSMMPPEGTGASVAMNGGSQMHPLNPTDPNFRTGRPMMIGSDDGMGDMPRGPSMGGQDQNSWGAPDPNAPPQPAQRKFGLRFGSGPGGPGLSIGGTWGR